MANVYYKRNYSFNFPKSFLTQIGSQLLDSGRYSYSIYTTENKNFWGSKSYETKIELRDCLHNLIKSKKIKDDTVDFDYAVIVSYDSLFYQSLIPECVDYLLNSALEYTNVEYFLFPSLYDVTDYTIDGYKIGDRLSTSDISIMIPVDWEPGNQANKVFVEKGLKIAPLSEYTLYVKRDSATILYGKNDEVIYTFPNPKRIFSMFCYNIIKINTFLQF